MVWHILYLVGSVASAINTFLFEDTDTILTQIMDKLEDLADALIDIDNFSLPEGTIGENLELEDDEKTAEREELEIDDDLLEQFEEELKNRHPNSSDPEEVESEPEVSTGDGDNENPTDEPKITDIPEIPDDPEIPTGDGTPTGNAKTTEVGDLGTNTPGTSISNSNETSETTITDEEIEQFNDALNALNKFTLLVQQTGSSSDETAIELIYNSVYSEIGNGNMNAAEITLMLVDLKEQYPDLNFQISENGSYYDDETNTIYVDASDLNFDDESALLSTVKSMFYTMKMNNGLEALNILSYSGQTGTSSSEEAITILYNEIYSEIADGNMNASEIIQMLVALKEANPELNFQVSENGSYYDDETSTFYIDASDLNLEEGSTFSNTIENLYSTMVINNGLEALNQFSNTEIFSSFVDKALNQLSSSSSNNEAIETLYNTIYSELENGNTDVSEIIQMIVTLKEENPELNFQVSENGSYCDDETSTIYVDASDLEFESQNVFLNNIGNMIFSLLLLEGTSENINESSLSNSTNSNSSSNTSNVEISSIENVEESSSNNNTENTNTITISEEEIPEDANNILNEAKTYIETDGQAKIEEILNMINDLNEESVDNSSNAFINILNTISNLDTENEEFDNISVINSLLEDFSELKADENEIYLESIKDCFGTDFYNLLENLYNIFYN